MSILKKTQAIIDKDRGVIALFAYLITLFVSRFTVFLIENHKNIPLIGYNIINGYHIHHFSYGVVLLVTLSFSQLFFDIDNHGRKIYLIFGIALGLIFDEFGIWLKLDPNYHQFESIAGLVTVGMILILAVYVDNFLPNKKIRIAKIRSKD